MNKYLAKSAKRGDGTFEGETIVDHTKDLLYQWKLIKKEYPNALTDREWQLLKIACQYHDLGKMNVKFQTRLMKNHKWMENGEVPHALLSVSLVPTKQLKQEKGFSEEEIEALCYAIALHHDRNFNEITETQYEREVDNLKSVAATFPFSDLGLQQTKPRILSARYYSFNYYPSTKESWYKEFVVLKGMLNRIDYAASGHYKVESTPRIHVEENVLETWRKRQPHANWNELQEWTSKHQNENIVLVGQTGMGKTEAALRWLDNSKGFFLLPLRSAINSIYQRLSDSYQLDEEHLTLLHSDIMSYLLENEYKSHSKINITQLTRMVNESRQLSKQLTIATLDQLFNFVYHYRGFELKLATLSYSKVVIDEIQMYSPDLLAYILYGLKLVQAYGGHFQVMTATLAPFILDLMRDNGLKFKQPDHPFIDNQRLCRHSVKVEHQQISADEIIKHYHANKVLVVCNTINEAEKLFDELNSKIDNIHLIHSRFIRKDRSKLEQDICEFGKASSGEHGIWIGTQVVEVSLDIDFDILLTELSELNGLFQRMGRCYRKRQFDGDGYNVYVFDGGNDTPSGIGNNEKSVVDYGMYTLAKKALAGVDGLLDEKQKIKLINETYTTDNLQTVSQSYISQIKGIFAYLDSISNDRLTKAEVIKRFRDIDSVNVIPEQVYEQYQDKIHAAAEVLIETADANNSNDHKKQRLIALTNLKQYTVSVPLWITGETNKNLVVNEELNQCGFHILTKAFNYDSVRGLSNSYNADRDKDNDNFF